MKKVTLLLAALLVFTAVSLSAQNAQTRLDNGKRLFDQRNYDGAIREFDEAIKLDPNMAEAYAYRARAYVGNNNDQALSDANKAIQLNSRLAMGYLARGNVYRNKKDYDRAIADYTEAIRLDPQNAIAYYNRGNSYDDKKDYDRAIADFTEAIRLNPRYVNAYVNRGVAYKNKNDYDRAIADYTEAIRLDPQNVFAYYNRGNAYDDKKDYDRAIADFTEALRINPNLSQAKNNLKIAEDNKRKSFDPSKFAVVPSDFRPADYTKVDLFRAASTSKNLEISSNKYDAMSNQLKTDLSFGLVGGNYYLMYVSDVTFVRQNGTNITFSSDDNAISQMMSIDQRSGLQAGQRVRIYYTIASTPLTTWDVIAIERR